MNQVGIKRAISKQQGGRDIFLGPWSHASSIPRYPLGAIHVFRLSQDDWAKGLGLEYVLSREEAARLASMGNRERRRSFLASRTALRLLLSSHLDLPPTDVPISEARSGKPALAAPYKDQISFSLSHSGGWILIALRKGGRVGIDIELARESLAYEALARRFFHRDEAAALASSNGEAQRDLFYAIWTMKEACLKAMGRGIAGGLSGFSVLPLLRQNLGGVEGHLLESLPGIAAVGIPIEGPYCASIAGDPPLEGISLLDCRASLFF